jgi:hypothetical protein
VPPANRVVEGGIPTVVVVGTTVVVMVVDATEAAGVVVAAGAVVVVEGAAVVVGVPVVVTSAVAVGTVVAVGLTDVVATTVVAGVPVVAGAAVKSVAWSDAPPQAPTNPSTTTTNADHFTRRILESFLPKPEEQSPACAASQGSISGGLSNVGPRVSIRKTSGVEIKQGFPAGRVQAARHRETTRTSANC